MKLTQTPRERLVATAAKLFYERGLPNVGINEVTERAGIARMTLYNNFVSKEELALAAFEHQAERRRAMIVKQSNCRRSASGKLQALFDVAESLAREPAFCGCAFINFALQQPDSKSRLHALAREHKAWIRTYIQTLAETAGARGSARLAQQILALWDGAIVET
ncbi:MAG: TetR/AcrR family transcriptional regulator, partial [Pseudolabrys sp.]